MRQLISLLLFLLPAMAVSGRAPIDQDSLIAKIFARDPIEFNLEKMERYYEGDTTDIYSPGDIVILPLDVDTLQFVAMVSWGPEGTRGTLTDFYLFDRIGPSLEIKAITSPSNDLIYGGGTQRYGEIVFSERRTLQLADTVIGFEVILGSYHFASQSEGEENYLFAIIGNEIVQATVHSNSRFMGLGLKEMDPDDQESIHQILDNLEELMPSEYTRDCICESETELRLLPSSTEGLRDLQLQTIEYQLKDKRLVKTVKEETYQWQGDEYRVRDTKSTEK